MFTTFSTSSKQKIVIVPSVVGDENTLYDLLRDLYPEPLTYRASVCKGSVVKEVPE